MKVVMTIAGSDSSGGAGIQADLKTFEAFGVFGTTVITVLTAQNTTGVSQISEVPVDFVKEQFNMVMKDIDVSAIKIGMLFSNEIIDTVRGLIQNLNIPVVFDPVCISKAGAKLLNDDAIENLKTIIPYATIVTPNSFEAQTLFGYDLENKDNLVNISESPIPILIKHHSLEVEGKMQSVDILYKKDSDKVMYKTPLIDTENTHGTGCSFSSAITANLALGKSLEQSIEKAKQFIYESMNNAPNIGNGKGPIAHKIGGENVK